MLSLPADLFPGRTFSPPFAPAELSGPANPMIAGRNAIFDWYFYNTGNLTRAEQEKLLGAQITEGKILVVRPSDDRGPVGISEFSGYGELCAAPGRKLRRFAVAGVGSTDLGAAAFARAVANRYQEPVGAVVAGYGILDLVSEGLGGFFNLGLKNRLYDSVGRRHEQRQTEVSTLEGTAVSSGSEPVITDTDTLEELLRDTSRNLLSLAGHSKGSLSIAEAFSRIEDDDDAETLNRLGGVRVLTVGAVVSLPAVIRNVAQYLGGADVLGLTNSDPFTPRTRVPFRGHHLNPLWPGALNFEELLADEPE